MGAGHSCFATRSINQLRELLQAHGLQSKTIGKAIWDESINDARLDRSPAELRTDLKRYMRLRAAGIEKVRRYFGSTDQCANKSD